MRSPRHHSICAALAALSLLAGCPDDPVGPGSDTGPIDGGGDSDAGAEVTPPDVKLTIFKNGAGVGVITSDPPGIDCGNTCFAEFPEGSTVELHPQPDGTTRFGGWGGACTGFDPCTPTLSGPTDVSVTWEPWQLPAHASAAFGEDGVDAAMAVVRGNADDVYVASLAGATDPDTFAGADVHLARHGADLDATHWSLTFEAGAACPIPALAAGSNGAVWLAGTAGDAADLSGQGGAGQGPGTFVATYGVAGGALGANAVFDGGCVADAAPFGAGGVAVTGWTDAASVDFGDGAMTTEADASLTVAAFGADASLAWARVFVTAPFDYAQGRAIAPTSDGGVVIAGSFANTGSIDFGGGALPTGSSVVLAGFDATGSHAWSTTFGGVDHDVADLAIAADGELVLAGIETRGAYEIAYLSRLGPQGTWLWTRELELTEKQGVAGLAVSGDGRIGLAGWTYVPMAPFRQVFLAEVSGSGVLRYAQQRGGPGDDAATAIAARPDGRFTVAGRFDSDAIDLTGGESLPASGAGEDGFLIVFGEAP